ncbi:cephalosporin hydroxylase family protein [Leptolyngbya sp. 15MV]|nr:cephalosporin hydroxylase family protein [Leptolyngbya sp. 15MV]
MSLHPHAVPPSFRAPRRRRGVKGWLDRWATRRFFEILIKRTNNFDRVRWLGEPAWQNVLDLWTIQETIAELRPDAIIETGTNRA